MHNLKLPLIFKPRFKTSLERIGKKNDGGYVIPVRSINETKNLFSFGMYDDWSFELDFHKKNPETKIMVFDKSVNAIFWIKRLIKNFLFLITFRLNFLKFLKSCFTYFSYRFFFLKKKCTHVKKFINSSRDSNQDAINNDFINLNEILVDYKSENFFLKIDIEGNEYRILEDIIQNQKNLLGLVIEFHDCDLMLEHIKKFINKINLNLVHIHVNNYGSINQKYFPSVIEFTFSKQKYNETRLSGDDVFPVKGLDEPNNIYKKDIGIEFKDE
jgi:hypothetical protein